MTAYIRTLDGVTMVRLAPHTYVNAAFVMRGRMPIDPATTWRWQRDHPRRQAPVDDRGTRLSPG